MSAKNMPLSFWIKTESPLCMFLIRLLIGGLHFYE